MSYIYINVATSNNFYIWHNTFHIYHIYPLRSMGSDHTFLTFTSSTITSVDPQIWGEIFPLAVSLKMERYLKTQSCMVKTNKYALISFIFIFQNQSVGIYVHQISIEMLSLSCVHSVFVCVYPDDGYINKPLYFWVHHKNPSRLTTGTLIL